MDKTIKILLVDDHEMISEALTAILTTVKGFEVVGSASNGQEAIEKIEILQPQVILMDIVMPVMNGLAATEFIKEKYPHIKIMVLSMEITNEYVKKAFQINVDGYIPKNADVNELINAIKVVYSGERYYDRRIKDYIFKFYMGDEDTSSPQISILSERELQVLKLISDGVGNKEIGNLLFISPKTVEAHRNNIMKKLKLESTAELIKYAIAKKITEIPRHMFEE